MENISYAESHKASFWKSVGKGISEIFSAVMDEEISPKQSLLIIQSIVSGLVTVFAVGMPLWFTVLSLGWFGLSLLMCKRAGLDGEESL